MSFFLKKRYWPHLATALVTFMVGAGFLLAHQSLNTPVDFHQTAYTGSENCRDCHADRYQSWERTYHRRMTQEASPTTVMGRFDGEKYTYWGYTVRPVREGDRFFFEYYDKSGQQLLNKLEITRTVGSRRYQQYLARTPHTGDNYYRLEMLWHIEDQRWVHLNGAFLGSDEQAFDNHTALWNQNCIFCHNTGVNPGLQNHRQLVENVKRGQPLNLLHNARYQSRVAELGIACESCHAGGEAHIQAEMRNPFRKYWQKLVSTTDHTIVNPAKLSKKRSVEVCGQCHGQRTPKTLDMARHWMEKGPTYRPGDPLTAHVNPVWRESTIQGRPTDIFATRFWPDGSPRLTAYEYQGLLQSACFQKADLTCLHCHNMHGGDPKGMMDDDKRGNAACADCHAKLVANPKPHTGHEEDSPGSLCYGCHMPYRVYGIMTFHRDHHIGNPNPDKEFSQDKPNACINCHLDKTGDWVLEHSARLWPGKKTEQPTPLPPQELVKSIQSLHAGDPVERALAAWNMGNHSHTLSFDKRRFLVPHLLLGMQDNYPAIRRFSFHSLRRIAQTLQAEDEDFIRLLNIIKPFDFIADIDQRRSVIEAALTWYQHVDKKHWGAPPEGSLLDATYRLDLTGVETLRQEAQSANKRIDVGE